MIDALGLPELRDRPDFRTNDLRVKNRLFRSSISGRWDNYNGSGTQARINWEEKFARGGIGAIISSFVPVHIRGRILPNYAMIDHDKNVGQVLKALDDLGIAHVPPLVHEDVQLDGALHPLAQGDGRVL